MLSFRLLYCVASCCGGGGGLKNCHQLFKLNMNCQNKHIHEAVLMSTHNLCFRAEIRKNVYPCTPQFYYIKVWCLGVYYDTTY